LFLAIALATGTQVLWGLPAWADPPPKVTFTASGIVPVSCGTHPNVTSLSVPENTAILIANETGVKGTVVVGGNNIIDISEGDGAKITLSIGQHEIKLVPQCMVVTGTDSVAVTITAKKGGPTATPSAATATPPVSIGSPSPGAPTTAASAPTSSSTTPGLPPTGSSGEVGSTMSAPVTPAGGALPSGAIVASSYPSATSSPPVEVLQADGVRLDDVVNPKDVRLLAVIATICVLGVTAAIIRSIVRLSP